ncbi:hypothetical protein R3P38DRAFT_3051372 [Favolaschia claudopus]|uniref:Secreted protein n=1 Tax=Favolaschia claudopus TaxID=2862362 RepID=A0AAW0A4E8_9AGAR
MPSDSRFLLFFFFFSFVEVVSPSASVAVSLARCSATSADVSPRSVLSFFFFFFSFTAADASRVELSATRGSPASRCFLRRFLSDSSSSTCPSSGSLWRFFFF